MTTSVSVMVVEDDQDIRDILSEVLIGAGYSAVTACNGAQALEILKTVKPGLILLDLNMPVMNGFEFRSLQKSDPAIAQIPTVVMSALHNMVAHLPELVIEEALEKPLELDQLLRVVEAHCGLRRARSVPSA
jgi:CheY-like chemotaxis protein